jgi:hypothetical protein
VKISEQIMKIRAHLVVPVLLLSTQLAVGQCKATVSGTVINDSGDPVPGASVTVVDEIGAKGLRHTFVHHETDSDGAFSFAITLGAPGKVWLYAMDEKDGYPNGMNAFYAEHDDQPLALDCGDYRSGVVIKVGPKAGYIEKVTVTDANTGKTIGTASITLRRVVPKITRIANIDIYLRAHTSVANIAIPSNVDISYEISAPGYATSSRKRVNVRPQEKISIVEQLVPSASGSGQPQ